MRSRRNNAPQDTGERDEGLVMLFPENFPDWALTPEARVKRDLRLVEARDDEPADDGR